MQVLAIFAACRYANPSHISALCKPACVPIAAPSEKTKDNEDEPIDNDLFQGVWRDTKAGFRSPSSPTPSLSGRGNPQVQEAEARLDAGTLTTYAVPELRSTFPLDP